MVAFEPVTALIGGSLIGLSATLLLLFNGQIAGISGIVNGAIEFKADRNWRWLFIAGLLIGGWLYERAIASQPTPTDEFSPWPMIIGGLLVGVGTRLGNGCTSGHGVCGLGRLSVRSLVAVLTFLTTGFITVFVTRHVLLLG
ncbi:MAG: putative transporter component [Phormidesmis priestleyi Ana]|uniref:Putative transporter component n=1 Tax=Phormidesmis priestleyi Ana TaxID=1666911 RepID=A0A0P7ZJE5_9CYAN|nr:MAG: putative transporter component [Phormidesmis priestleyi Ana]